MGKIKIIVVAGPTASGKSDLAIQLAEKLNGEIVSADSRQVYRGMDIGTGKVTKREQKMVPHWMLDVADPRRTYTVAQYKKAAQRAIANIAGRGKTPIICGGTGFYIDSLVYDLTLPSVKPDKKLRAQLEKLSTDQLFARLQKLDPQRASTIDRHNPRRLIRALEIVMATGKPVPPPANGSPYEPLYLAVSIPKAKLDHRIAKRLDARLRGGMIAEAKRLHAQGLSWKKMESFGLEYRWLARHLSRSARSREARQEMRDGLLRDIIHYAKRQMTWFKRNKDIRWVTNLAQATRLAKNFLKG